MDCGHIGGGAKSGPAYVGGQWQIDEVWMQGDANWIGKARVEKGYGKYGGGKAEGTYGGVKGGKDAY